MLVEKHVPLFNLNEAVKLCEKIRIQVSVSKKLTSIWWQPYRRIVVFATIAAGSQTIPEVTLLESLERINFHEIGKCDF